MRTEQELVNLTLSLMLDRVVSSLHAGGVHGQLTTSSIVLASYLHSRLRSRRTRTWCSYLSVIAFVGFLHVLAPDVLNFNFFFISSPTITIINDNTKLIKLVQATRVIQVTSALIIITLSSPFDLIRIYQLVSQVLLLRICIWVILIALVISEAVLGFLRLLARLLLIMILLVIVAVLIALVAALSLRKLVGFAVAVLETWASSRLLKLLINLLLLKFLLFQLINLVLVLF